MLVNVDVDVVVDVDGAGVSVVFMAGLVYEQGGSHKSFGQIGDSW